MVNIDRIAIISEASLYISTDSNNNNMIYSLKGILRP